MNADSAGDNQIIVVGSGVAGLEAALAAAELGSRVLLITAGELPSGSSWWAQGGIAAAVGPDDNPALHRGDTLAVGVRLNDLPSVDVLTAEGREAILELVRSGVAFDGIDGAPELGLEAGHSRRRILHAGGGATGAVVSEALIDRAQHLANVQALTNTPVDRLVVRNGRVVGVGCGDAIYRGKAVVIATGGYAGLWGRSTNPSYNRGVGLHLAWEAGASLADLEFVQFHPTALNLPGAPAFLLSEALRGEGALLVDSEGEAVVDPLLPRDVVARAIDRYMKEHGPVFLTMQHLDPAVKGHFRSIARQLAEFGLDLVRDLIPVAPAAHYCMGGVRTDIQGRTDVPGLYAAGEVACTGVQGANRLASNSLLECLVFGRRAAIAAVQDAPERSAQFATRELPALVELPCGEMGSRDGHYPAGSLGARLDRDLCVERNGMDLAALVADLPEPTGGVPSDHLAASLAARGALLRTESRGAHYRTDCTATLPEWRGRIVWRRDEAPRFEEVNG
jgi:L-aspartate oxidase